MLRFGLKWCAFLFCPEKKTRVCQCHLLVWFWNAIKGRVSPTVFWNMLKILLDLAFFVIYGEQLWHCYSNDISESLNRWFLHWLGWKQLPPSWWGFFAVHRSWYLDRALVRLLFSFQYKYCVTSVILWWSVVPPRLKFFLLKRRGVIVIVFLNFQCWCNTLN